MLITYNYAQAQGIKIGDSITLAGNSYTVRGLCIRPDYAAMYANMEDSFPNSTDFGIVQLSAIFWDLRCAIRLQGCSICICSILPSISSIRCRFRS